MTEKEIKSLGFEKVFVSAEESGGESFHYYSIKIGDIDFLAEDGVVYLLDSNTFYVEDYETAKQLIDIINSCTNNNKNK